jgi:hypothetical protein
MSEAFDGSVSVESEKGEGSTFRFEFKLEAEDLQHIVQKVEQSFSDTEELNASFELLNSLELMKSVDIPTLSFLQHNKKKQILLIDDEIFNLQALEIMLGTAARSLGYPEKLLENNTQKTTDSEDVLSIIRQ